MRDLLVTLLVFGSLPFVFKRPWLGAVLWIWISVMNPHSQGYGFARTMPFAAIIAATAFASWFISNERNRLPASPVTLVFVLFLLWMSVTSLGAIHPDLVTTQWIKVYKIFGMNLLVMMLLQKREHILAAVWTMVVSVGVYGVKGGLFTIRSGGSDRVWGPTGTFIEGNNELALALVTIIPLMFYLHSLLVKRWQRHLMLGSVFLCALASLGSYSRGAALALGAMAGFLWLKSEKKVTMGLAMVVATPVLLLIMPAKWFERIDTINTYQEDASSMGRINAWKMAWNLASDRFLGGGFEIYDYGVFMQYAPVPEDVHAAHSLYFQVLGEHGFVGLALYLLLGFLTFRTGSWIIRHTKGRDEMKWAASLAKMSQVSLLGFSVGGAFLSLAYFDVPYYLMAVLVATRVVIERELKAEADMERDAARRQKEEARALAMAAPQGQTAQGSGNEIG